MNLEGVTVTEPLVFYAHPLYRIDQPPSCAAFVGLDADGLEDWRGRALRAEGDADRLRAALAAVWGHADLDEGAASPAELRRAVYLARQEAGAALEETP